MSHFCNKSTLNPSLSRRRAITRVCTAVGGAAAMVALPRTALALASSDTIVLGQSVCINGPLAGLGRPMQLGASACFAFANKSGGVAGRQIELISKDDGYDVKRSVQNVESFLADKRLLSLFGVMGTPMVEATLKLIKSSDVPLFAPFTGASVTRPKDTRNVLPVRASFAEEANRLAQHLTTIGYRNVAIVFQDNGYGREVATAAEASLKEASRPPLFLVSVKSDSSDAKAAVDRVVGSQADAVILGLVGRPVVDVVLALKASGSGRPIYSVSAAGTPEVIKALKSDARGITVSQVMPAPTDVRLGVVRDFLKAWNAAGVTEEPSYAAIEGYVCARLLIEVLKKAGPSITRQSFVEAAWNLKAVDLGGYFIGFERPGLGASRLVELTMVKEDGRFMR